MFTLTYPWFLASLQVVALLLPLGLRRSLAELTTAQRRVCLAVRAILLLSIVLALAGVRWRERVDHNELNRLYRECDFTVYPSVLEGFGLPVIESLWLGRPCVCANFSVMAENAAGGGCLTCDVRDPQSLAEAIIRLAESPERRRQLAHEAIARPLKTWHEYAVAVLAAMQEEGRKV